jgi:hypothetical protein
MDASSPTSSKRPQRRAKEVAIQGLQLAKAEELRDFSDFMDPEEIRARKWKAPAKQKQPTKQAAEAHEDRVEHPLGDWLTNKSNNRFLSKVEWFVTKVKCLPKK